MVGSPDSLLDLEFGSSRDFYISPPASYSHLVINTITLIPNMLQLYSLYCSPAGACLLCRLSCVFLASRDDATNPKRIPPQEYKGNLSLKKKELSGNWYMNLGDGAMNFNQAAAIEVH